MGVRQPNHYYDLSAYHYDLPKERIAQYPAMPRDSSRLLIVDRKRGTFQECVFRELVHILNPGDQLIFNDTKVIPARLIGKRKTGGMAEILLSKHIEKDRWEVLARPGKKLKEGAVITFSDHFFCTIDKVMEDGKRQVLFTYDGDFYELLNQYGQMPLPKYIQRHYDQEFDENRYQTVYATQKGAIAAPTAGLHFTQELLEKLKKKSVHINYITLHVGLGTFLPVKEEDIRKHKMHSEHIIISKEAEKELNCSNKKRRICVGTTTLRALETVANEKGVVKAGEYDSDIFIYPGYRFKYTQSLLTNFHLPKSSLLMLVSAFAGYELMMEAYHYAIKNDFRFYSYGDAMLIL